MDPTSSCAELLLAELARGTLHSRTESIRGSCQGSGWSGGRGKAAIGDREGAREEVCVRTQAGTARAHSSSNYVDMPSLDIRSLSMLVVVISVNG